MSLQTYLNSVHSVNRNIELIDFFLNLKVPAQQCNTGYCQAQPKPQQGNLTGIYQVQKLEDDLNFLGKWKTTSNCKANERRPQLFGPGALDDLNYFVTGR